MADTPQKVKIGRSKLLTTHMRKRLVATTTASQQKASIPLIQVAEIADIVASNETLQDAFASEDYHGPVA